MQTTRQRLTVRIGLPFLSALLLAACGMKGPLTLPPPPAPDATLTAPPIVAPTDTGTPATKP